MVDWNSPAVLQAQGTAFLRLQHVMAGWYFWEFVVSCSFDWKFISGSHKFRWPMIFYFAGRYCLLFAIIGLLIALDVTDTEINCKPLFGFLQFAGNGAVGFASINLAIRTMAIWGQQLSIVIPLVILILGHWTLIFQGVIVQTQWVPGSGCVIIATRPNILSAMFIYSVCLDFIVLVLAAWKLYDRRGHSQIVKLLFQDGLIYFTVAFFANIVATTFMLLNLNPVMTSMFNVPAALAGTVVACRAVRRLFKFSQKTPEVYTGIKVENTQEGKDRGRVPSRSIAFATHPTADIAMQGVHVKMTTETDSHGDYKGGNSRFD
ncbi:hypothetical protein BXZ70DRAFT_913471 [Cristinia sonorae]|uniref:Uncharacterized protein n=1 Tax=Cristinia sonorae TaxID=1940300 RepID=A0A8K0XUV2_9AGAR|nr:hypothetical protein BXZ70DRAFT_913471 [Cristinia sonorae]